LILRKKNFLPVSNSFSTRKILCAVWFGFICVGNLLGQPGTDSATFLLHKFQQQIGKESYVVKRSDRSVTYSIDFRFVDRGMAVPLSASIQLSSSGEPQSFAVKGRTSRFSIIADTVTVEGQKAFIHEGDSAYTKSLSSISFPIAGFSPGTVQMLLIQYWKTHNHPQSISTLPSGSVSIKLDGLDTFRFGKSRLILERYVIGGLIWGNELLWTDKSGNLFCLITNDAEGDKLEMMLEPYESLLSVFIDQAAKTSMQLFTRSSKQSILSPTIIAIKNGDVVDIVNKKKVKDVVVIIRNGTIESITPTAQAKIPAGAHVIDASGKTILPGLWDMHAHFEQAEWGPAYLAAGVTTVRDCGNEFVYINAIQNAIDNGKGVGPHIIKAGIIDGKSKMSLGIVQADNKNEAIGAVQRYKKNGFEQIKVYSSVKPEVVKAICNEAHRLGMTVTGHIPDGMNLIQAVDSGMDMVNHIQYVTQILKKRASNGVIDFSDSSNIAALEFIRDNHVIVDPTLGVYEMIFRALDDSITIIEHRFKQLPGPLQSQFANTGMPPTEAERMKGVMTGLKATVKRMHDLGVNIVAGTDMGIPGWSVCRELELYVESGLTPAEALQTATIIPAIVMKKDRFYGSIEAGKKADVIIVDGDPLQNISDLRKLNTVIKDGKIYNPVQLHRMVGFDVN